MIFKENISGGTIEDNRAYPQTQSFKHIGIPENSQTYLKELQQKLAKLVKTPQQNSQIKSNGQQFTKGKRLSEASQQKNEDVLAKNIQSLNTSVNNEKNFSGLVYTPANKNIITSPKAIPSENAQTIQFKNNRGKKVIKKDSNQKLNKNQFSQKNMKFNKSNEQNTNSNPILNYQITNNTNLSKKQVVISTKPQFYNSYKNNKQLNSSLKVKKNQFFKVEPHSSGENGLNQNQQMEKIKQDLIDERTHKQQYQIQLHKEWQMKRNTLKDHQHQIKMLKESYQQQLEHKNQQNLTLSQKLEDSEQQNNRLKQVLGQKEQINKDLQMKLIKMRKQNADLRQKLKENIKQKASMEEKMEHIQKNHEASVKNIIQQGKLDEVQKSRILKNLQDKLAALEEKYKTATVEIRIKDSYIEEMGANHKGKQQISSQSLRIKLEKAQKKLQQYDRPDVDG